MANAAETLIGADVFLSNFLPLLGRSAWRKEKPGFMLPTFNLRNEHFLPTIEFPGLRVQLGLFLVLCSQRGLVFGRNQFSFGLVYMVGPISQFRLSFGAMVILAIHAEWKWCANCAHIQLSLGSLHPKVIIPNWRQ